MKNKSWIVTIVPLIAYLIGFAYSIASGQELSDQQVALLTNLLYGFIGSGAIGGSVAIAHKLKG